MDRNQPSVRIPPVLFWLFCGILLRLSFILVLDHPLASDEKEYHRLATSIINDGSFSGPDGPTAFRPPGYPFLLSLLMSVHPSPEFVRIVQAALEMVIAWMLLLIGRTAGQERTGMFTLAVWCCFPASILMPGLLLSETAFTLLLIVGIYFALKDDTGAVIAASAVAGAAMLMKPQAGVLAAVSIVRLFLAGRMRHALTAAMIIGFITVPWMMRNDAVLGTAVLTTNGGVNFWIGNNPEATGGYFIPKNVPLPVMQDEAARNSEAYARGWSFVTGEPLRALTLLPMKAAHFWSPEHYLLPMSLGLLNADMPYKEQLRRLSPAFLLVVDLPALLLLILGTAGFFLAPGSARQTNRMLLWTILLWMAAHLPYFGAARFHYPLLPLFAFSAATTFFHRGQVVELPRHALFLLTVLCAVPAIIYGAVYSALFL